MELTFNKEESNKWFIVLPEWEGDKWELEMVAGADIMCDVLSNGNNVLTIDLQLEPTEGYDKLTLLSICRDDLWQFDSQGYPESGAFYQVETLKGLEYNKSIWLCDVTLFVLGSFPEILYLKKI